MIDPIINGIVLVIFGLAIGGVLQLFALLNRGFSVERSRRRVPQKEGERKRVIGLRSFLKESKERANQSRRSIRTLPRSATISMAAFYGLLIVFILIIKFSPIEMRWLIFLGSVLVGFFIMNNIFIRAKKGKIRVEGNSVFDVLPKEKSD